MPGIMLFIQEQEGLTRAQAAVASRLAVTGGLGEDLKGGRYRRQGRHTHISSGGV